MILAALVASLVPVYLLSRWLLNRRRIQAANRLAADNLLAASRAGMRAAEDRINEAYARSLVEPVRKIANPSRKEVLAYQRSIRRGAVKEVRS